MRSNVFKKSIVILFFVGSSVYHAPVECQRLTKKRFSPIKRPLPKIPTKSQRTAKKRVSPIKRPLPKIPTKPAAAMSKKTERTIQEGKKAVARAKSSAIGIVPKLIIGIAELVTLGVVRDIPLVQIADIFKIPEGPVRDYLGRFVITTPLVVSRKNGFAIHGIVTIKGNIIRAMLEVGKTDEGRWYGIFYVKVQDKWKLSDFFPNIDLKTVIPQIGDAIAKKVTPDLLEFEDSFFILSTTDIDGHPDLGNINAGFRFNANARFIGLFKIFDEIFGLNGKTIQASGLIGHPINTSYLSLNIPTAGSILPESFTFQGVKKDIIKGFYVRLAPFTFDIKLRQVAGIILPFIEARPAIKVKFPNVPKEVEFFGEFGFFGEKLKLGVGLKDDIENLFGVKGVKLDAGKGGLTWNLINALRTIAVTAGAGAALAILPSGVAFKGGISSPGTALKLDFNLEITPIGANIKFYSNGTLVTHEMAAFLIRNVFKKPEDLEKLKKFIPKLVIRDAVIDIDFSETAKTKHFQLGIGELELIPGCPASGFIKIEESGFGGKLQTCVVNFPKKDPKVIFSSASDPKKGPNMLLDFDFLKNPPDFLVQLDGFMHIDLGALGKITSKTEGRVAQDGIQLESRTQLLGGDAGVKVVAQKNELDLLDPSTIKVDIEFKGKGLLHISNTLKYAVKAALIKAKKDLVKNQRETIEKLESEEEKKIRSMETQITPEIKKLLDLQISRDDAKKSIEEDVYEYKYKVIKKSIETKKEKINAVRYPNQMARTLVYHAGNVLKTGLDVANVFREGAQKITEALGQIEKLFKVTEFKLRVNVSEIMLGKPPLVYAKGEILGKPFEIGGEAFNVSNLANVATHIVKKQGLIPDIQVKQKKITLTPAQKKAGLEGDMEPVDL